jgi:hypothetical protein
MIAFFSELVVPFCGLERAFRRAINDSPAGDSSWLTELLTKNRTARTYSPFVDHFWFCF